MNDESEDDEMRIRPLAEGPHSFIVRIWIESESQRGRLKPWRGHIIHVSTNRRRYLRRLTDIVAFIKPYLASEENKSGWFRRLRKWLRVS